MRVFLAHPVFLLLLTASIAAGQTPPKPDTTLTLPLTGTVKITIPGTIAGPPGPKGDSVVGPMGPAGKDGRDGKDGNGLPGRPSTGGRGIDVTQAPYFVGTGNGDDETPLRALMRTFTGNQAHTLRFPGAAIRLDRPLLIYKQNVTLDGAGMGETQLMTYGRYPAVVIGQLDPETPDGKFTYDYGSRPDVGKILDGTVNGYGFRTYGRSYAIDSGNGLAYGTYDRAIKCWSYWANTPGFTIEYAISGAPAPGSVIFGVGDAQFRPAPFAVAVADAHTIWHVFAIDGDPDAHPRISVVSGIDFTRPVNRIRESHDHTTGEVIVWVNGVNQTPVPRNLGDLDIKGKSLKRNDHVRTFMIGPNDGPAPDFTLLGLKVTAAPVPTDAGTDNARYLTQTPGCVGGFDSTIRDPEGYRGLRMFGGPSAADGYGYALVFDKISNGVSPAHTTIKDLSANSSIMLAGANNTTLSNVSAGGKSFGLGAYPNFASWPLLTESCTFFGDVAAVQGDRWIATHNNMSIMNGGIASVIMKGCKNTYNDLGIWGFGVRQEWAFLDYFGQYAGQIFIRSLTVDGEWQVLKSGAILVENGPGQARVLSIDGGAIGGVGPGGTTILLTDSRDPGAFAAHVSVRNCGLVAGLPAAVVGKDWYGSIDDTLDGPTDLSQPRLALPPVGPGASRVKFGGP